MYQLKKKPKIETKGIADKIADGLIWAFIIPAAITSPFALYALVIGATRYYFRRYEFNREVKKLQKKGYVALTKTNEGWLIRLLPKGRKWLKRVEFEKLALPKPKAWDGKWRLFSFDIPQELTTARNMMRRKLKSLGCYNIQRSLFAYPYDCRKELQTVAEYYEVAKYTLFAEVVYTDLDKELRKFFSL
ncbi:MAG: hypothetical protein HYW51_04035 [Candidatus Doudnabacteria bacterium]|nr:hypothetical protein [Candidatus Doudnabacteria bacterium]